MKRDFARLGDGPFDVLVVGGGIYGSWVAYDAVLRGLRVALIERSDWAAGTSSASTKLIHADLRALERGRIAAVRRALHERSRLRRLAPHRVQPVRLLMPAYAKDGSSRMRSKAGLWLYDRLGGRDPSVEPHRTLDTEETLRYYELRTEGLKGGFLFGDFQTDDARFVLEIVDGAIRAGAVAVNRVEASDLLTEGSRVVGACVNDLESGATTTVRATVTVSCTGAWTGRFDPGAPGPRLTKGVHLVLPPLPADEGLVIPAAEDGRFVFVLPWYGRTLLGTTSTEFEGSPDDVRVEPRDVDYLLGCANRVIAGAPWRPSDVIASFAGLRSSTDAAGSSEAADDWRLDEPAEGLLVSLGGQYSCARVDAATAVDHVLRLLGRGSLPCATTDRALPWAPSGDYQQWSAEMLRIGLGLGLDEETAEHCQQRHGARIERIYERIRAAPELAQRILRDTPFCLAEVVHAVNEEMACTLEDVVRRRIPLTLVSRVPSSKVAELGAVMSALLRWPEARRQWEIATVAPPEERVELPVHGMA